MSIADITHTLICDIIGWEIIDGHVKYEIKCERPLNNQKWFIKRRYNEFFNLNTQLLPCGLDLNLPPKKTFGNKDPKFIEERKNGLQLFLNKITIHPLLYCSTPVYIFLSNNGKQIIDEIHQNCSLSLRNYRNYVVEENLDDLGWRYCKKFMTVMHLTTRKTHLYSWMNYGYDSCCTTSEYKLILQFLRELHCPYLSESYLTFADQYGIGVITDYWKTGSLRDQLYRKSPKESFWLKYSMDNECFVLNSIDVKFIARQVLEVLYLFNSISYPYFYIHCGNIHIKDTGCEISDYEFALTGQSSFNRPAMIRSKAINSIEDLMVFNFGQLVYEMISGVLVFPDHCAEQAIDKLPVVFQPLLRSIFLPASKLPSLSELINDKLFSDIPVIRMSQRTIQIPGNVKLKLEQLSNTILNRFLSDKTTFNEKHKSEHLEELMYSDFEKQRRKELVIAQLKTKDSKDSVPVN